MKPLPVYSIELRLAAPIALAAAASLPPSCAWLALAIASTKATMTIRRIVSSHARELFRPLAGLSFRLGIPPHRAAPCKADQASVALRFAAALQAICNTAQ